MPDTPLSCAHPADALLLARLAPAVAARMRPLRLMAFDVDGVLTDGRLWYGEQGEAVKAFHAHDGHGLKLLMEGGIQVALITGRDSRIVDRRAAELGIAQVHQGVRDKAQLLGDIAQAQGLALGEIGFMGDDLIDLRAMQRVGFAATVADAPTYVAQAAHWTASRAGGLGAARECCDFILAAQGRLGALLSHSLPAPAGGSLQ